MFSSLLGGFLKLKALGQRIFIFLVSLKKKINSARHLSKNLCHYTLLPAMHENSISSALTGYLNAKTRIPSFCPGSKEEKQWAPFTSISLPPTIFFPLLALPISLTCAFICQNQGGWSSVLPLVFHHACSCLGPAKTKKPHGRLSRGHLMSELLSLIKKNNYELRKL